MFYFQLPFYIGVGLFKTRKFAPAKKQHKYAVLVAARNEEAVIGNLISSINNQDYPENLITVFVVADNCTDKTAAVARKMGAVCYERFDTQHCTKGYALQFLVKHIERDYGTQSFDGYFVFDADNLLKEDYFTRMNEAFDSGEKIVTSYRHTKNFDENWISASYAIHWLRTVRTEHRARSVFRLASRIQGTGFLFAAEIIKDGWNYVKLTEDRSFCADAVVKGYRISFNYDAIFYDEQPTNLKIAMRQRIRWAKGNLQSFTESSGKLFLHIFHKENKNENKNDGLLKKLIKSIHFRFMSFDMLTVTFPYPLITFFKRLVVDVLGLFVFFTYSADTEIGIISKTVEKVWAIFGTEKVINRTQTGIILLVLAMIAEIVFTWIINSCIAAFILITERRRIKSIKWYKSVLYCLGFPFFDFIGEIAMFIALFSKVEWKPIPHKSEISIEDLNIKTEEKILISKK
jgi:cellulose synthase/poly-beta-1,6-N-acetylglucosamine synthase-like glycosyltransferase